MCRLFEKLVEYNSDKTFTDGCSDVAETSIANGNGGFFYFFFYLYLYYIYFIIYENTEIVKNV